MQEALSVAAEIQTCSNSENDLMAQNQMVHLLCISGRIEEAEQAADNAAAYAAQASTRGVRGAVATGAAAVVVCFTVV